MSCSTRAPAILQVSIIRQLFSNITTVPRHVSNTIDITAKSFIFNKYHVVNVVNYLEIVDKYPTLTKSYKGNEKYIIKLFLFLDSLYLLILYRYNR